MKQFIPLSELVGQDQIDAIEQFEQSPHTTTRHQVRHVVCTYHTASKRQLWQAVGIEHIEPELLDYIDQMTPGSVFYDIGASNGIFSVYAAHKGLNVFAFEPEIQNFGLLGMNSYLNHRETAYPIRPFNIALSDLNGMSDLYIAKYEASGHQKILDRPQNVQESHNFEPEYVQNVLTFRLDDFIATYRLPVPTYMKIDVDGAELKVLHGAEKTLQNHALTSLFIELEDQQSTTASILNLFKSYGFAVTKKVQVQHYSGLYNYILERA